MSPSSAAAPTTIGVLIADSNRMQSQLLTSALRRHSEFHITTCPMDTASILQAVNVKHPRIALLSLNANANISETVTTLRRFHLSHPEIPKVLLVGHLRSRTRSQRVSLRGARHLPHHRRQPPPAVQVPSPCGRGTDLGQHRATQLHHGPHLGNSLSARAQYSGHEPAHPARGTSCRPRRRRTRQPRDCPRTQPQRAHHQEIPLPYLRKARHLDRVELVLYAVNNGDPRQAEWLAGTTRILPSA